MLSLVVFLDPLSPDEEFNFALSRNAVPGLEPSDAEATSNALPEHGSAPLALLPDAAEVVAVVPARRLSWHRITLPKVNGARLRIALDGLLEDRLLVEPQSLHFALAPGAAHDQAVWVAACDRLWLHAALHAFEAAGRQVARIVPEFSPLAEGSPPTLHITGTPENAWIVRSASDGVQVLPLRPFEATFMPAVLDLTEIVEQPTSEPAVAVMAEQALGAPLRVRHNAQSLVVAARSGWDLAQFDLASTGRTRAARRFAQAWAKGAQSEAWRPVRWGLAVLLLVWLFGLNAGAWKERSALQAKRLQVNTLLTQTFPKVPLVVDAPVQMAREVAAMRQATGALSALDLEPMLASVAENLKPGRAPSTIEFAPGALTLGGLSLPVAESAALTQGLAAAGYSARIDGTNWIVGPPLAVDAGVRP